MSETWESSLTLPLANTIPTPSLSIIPKSCWIFLKTYHKAIVFHLQFCLPSLSHHHLSQQHLAALLASSFSSFSLFTIFKIVLFMELMYIFTIQGLPSFSWYQPAQLSNLTWPLSHHCFLHSSCSIAYFSPLNLPAHFGYCFLCWNTLLLPSLAVA